MVRRNAKLIPTTEKSGLATPLWSDSEFKTLLGEQIRGLHGLKTEARTRPVPEIVWPNPTRPERHS